VKPGQRYEEKVKDGPQLGDQKKDDQGESLQVRNVCQQEPSWGKRKTTKTNSKEEKETLIKKGQHKKP